MRLEIREMVHGKCNGHCGYCGVPIKYSEMQVDHIISQRNYMFHILNEHEVPEFLSHLGIDDMNSIDNLMPTCRSCNLFKTSMSLERFRYELGMQKERLKNNTQYKRALKYGLVVEVDRNITFFFEKMKNFGLSY